MIIDDSKNVATLSSSMKFAFRKSSSSVAYCALTIRSGTANEPAGLSGLAHLVEHMLFKGTAKRDAANINNRLERLGGELNAYTTKEETVIYATVLREDLQKAVDLIFEIVFTSLFETKDLEKEKQVIYDEINLYRDSPSEYIFDDYEKYLFDGTPLSRSVLGTATALKKITSQHLKEYVMQMFIPERMCLSIVADGDFAKLTAMVEKISAKYVPQAIGAIHLTDNELYDPLPYTPFKIDKNKNNHQSNCIIGSQAYSLYNESRIPLTLLTNILGGPSCNSRLNSLIREKKALAYTIEANYYQYAASGSFSIYFGCERQNVDTCIALVLKELSHTCCVSISPTALKMAKKQMQAQIAISSENGEAQALAMGKSVVTYGSYLSDRQIREKIEAITADDLMAVAQEILAPEQLSMIIYR